MWGDASQYPVTRGEHQTGPKEEEDVDMIEVERFILIGSLLQGSSIKVRGTSVPLLLRDMIEVVRFILIGCLLQASPPKPKLTPEKVEVTEGTSVSLSCSAAAPCPKLPPNLTWTPSLNDSVDQLQENDDQTKSVSSVLTFTASHLHHGQKITCRALYKLQQGDIQKTSNTSLTLRVLYPPKSTAVSISPSGSVLEGSSVTLTCSSNGNPPVQHYTWYKVNGREMNTVGTGQDLTFNVTESSGSEQYYCEAQNEHGKENSTTVQLEVDYGSSVTLTCSSNANPPVQHYTWYKVNGREMNTVGTGQNLTFNVPESSGSEQYYCEAQNQHGKENSPTVQLEVDYPPKNTSAFVSPSGSVLEGSSVTLTCSSNANPPVQNYTWYKVNGREIKTVGTGQHLTFNVTESSGSEQCYCEAQNEHGKENSPTVQLEVDYPPKNTSVFVSPSGSLLDGSSVTLTCSSNANPPVQHYTWYKVNGREMNTVGTGQNLTFNVPESSGSEQYYCEAQNQHGKENSPTVQLEVDYPPKNTSAFVSPSGSVLEGSSVTLTCSSNANPPVQNYTWYKVNGREIKTVGTGQHLTFNVTESSGSEQCYCEAQNEHGKENSPTVQLEVDYPPKNTSVFVSPSGSVLEGISVTLTCSSKANPPVQNYTWYKVNGREMNTVGTGQDLTFNVTESSGSEQYYCEAQNQHGKKNSPTVQLQVDYPPKNTSVSVSPSGSVLEGSSVTLTCSSKANPPVQNYTWYKVNGREMNTVGTGQDLTFNVTESSGSEQYYCEAQNQHGKKNSPTVQLEVDYMPQISDSGSCSRTAAEISCSCESRGNPSPSMEWRVSGLRVTNSTDRVISEEQLGNTGLRSSLTMRHSQGDTPTVRCLSTNTVGSSRLTLHVPSPQQHPGKRAHISRL
ncbi:hypothetical protein SKAU_G00418520 [Synaphobranchus kaupii]|uniref:Ig-like domain-containing protein n=1 Tax=Synaphobranchus kaupii TaxID=118154 RepID=A0A9Q1IAW6_SYNKA|nr:hypothetical protein SKAU_G00418520 [Synaphobranchus kaupii]